MRLFASELGTNYDSYSFGYCLYAEREDDALSDMYAAGFLPYSGTPVSNIAYMARSVRIALSGWDMTSENRRIYRKFSGLERTVVPKPTFQDPDLMVEFCRTYFASRHGESVMPEERLRRILDSDWVTHIAEYRLEGSLLAYVWLGQGAAATHFYYSFYDLDYVNRSLGLWLMLDSALESKAKGTEHLYLGTAYGTKGLYKTNFDCLEFWDGSGWVADRGALRDLCRSDDNRRHVLTDRWKASR